jgi:acylglycerol lipase
LERFGELRSMSDGVGVYCREWTPTGPLKGTLCIIHGVGEHCGRYDHIAEQFGSAGYATFGFDLRGFGKSQGRRGHMRFARTLRDIDEMLADSRRRTDGAPLFLYGHSLGGLLALLYGLTYRPALTGVVVTGPALHTALRNQPVKVLIARTLGAIFPTLTVSSGLDVTKLSRDPEVLRAYRADPLTHPRISLGFARDGGEAIDRVLRDAARFELPLLLVHGGADEINLVSGSREMAARHRGDCTLKVYDGVFHAVEHEPERAQIVSDIIGWLDARTSRGG